MPEQCSGLTSYFLLLLCFVVLMEQLMTLSTEPGD
jgi:hypothetical protein